MIALALTFVLIIILLSSLRSIRKRIFPGSKIWRALMIYLIVLVVAAGFYSVISTKVNKNVHYAKQSTPYQEGDLVNKAMHGNIKKINPNWLVKKWQKNFPYRNLNIQPHDMQYSIVVKKSSKLKGKIEVSLYKTEPVINGILIPRSNTGVHVNFKKNHLSYSNSPTRITTAFACYSFPIKQFAKQSSQSSDTQISFGDQLLYLRIPNDVTISGSHVTYVSKR